MNIFNRVYNDKFFGIINKYFLVFFTYIFLIDLYYIYIYFKYIYFKF